MTESHEKIGMEIETIPGQRRLFCAGAAAYTRVPFQYGDA
jgi:hypothetical protein